MVLIVAGFILFGPVPATRAQDPFEIRVERYEELRPGEFAFEEHVNDVAIGTANDRGSVAATNHQIHVSSELTAGIASHFSLGTMLMAAVVPGHAGLEY